MSTKEEKDGRKRPRCTMTWEGNSLDLVTGHYSQQMMDRIALFMTPRSGARCCACWKTEMIVVPAPLGSMAPVQSTIVYCTFCGFQWGLLDDWSAVEAAGNAYHEEKKNEDERLRGDPDGKHNGTSS